MTSRRTGPILTIAAPLVLAVWIAVPIACIWGLEWRWIPTALLAGAAVLFAGATVDMQLERRAAQREAEHERQALAAARPTSVGQQVSDTIDEFLRSLDKDQPK